MTALATASLAVVAWIIARIALASGSRGKSGLTAIAAPPTQRFSSVYVAGSRSTVTRTGLVRIAVRPGSPAGFVRAVIAPPVWPARPLCQSSGAPLHAAMMASARGAYCGYCGYGTTARLPLPGPGHRAGASGPAGGRTASRGPVR